MKLTTTFLTLSLLAILTMGFGSCSTIKVPANSVTFRTPSGQLTIVHPQNTALTNMDISIATNGTVRAKIGGMVTYNSPDVIDRVAAGEVAKINAIGIQVREGVKAGLEGAGAAAGAAVK